MLFETDKSDLYEIKIPLFAIFLVVFGPVWCHSFLMKWIGLDLYGAFQVTQSA